MESQNVHYYYVSTYVAPVTQRQTLRYALRRPCMYLVYFHRHLNACLDEDGGVCKLDKYVLG